MLLNKIPKSMTMVRYNYELNENKALMQHALNLSALDNKLNICYNKATKTLEVAWRGSVESAEVREGYMQIKEIIKLYKPVKWILDLHLRDSLRREDQRWVFTHFFPEALRLTGSDIFVAFILPVHVSHELVQELNGDELMQEDHFMIINHFLYTEEAKRWLEECIAVKAGA